MSDTITLTVKQVDRLHADIDSIREGLSHLYAVMDALQMLGLDKARARLVLTDMVVVRNCNDVQATLRNASEFRQDTDFKNKSNKEA